MYVVGILLLAGSGKRFGSSLPKQFHRLAGKRIYEYALETFLGLKQFHKILLVCSADWEEKVLSEILSYEDPRIEVVLGGSTRQESSFAALTACPQETTHVVIHDAIRPFLSVGLLKEHLEALASYDAIDTCIPSHDTLVHSSDGKSIDAIPDRASLFRGQTPQSFYYPLLYRAHLEALAEGGPYTDDCGLVVKKGNEVHLLLGEESNLKITTSLDLLLAEQLVYTMQHIPTHKETLSLQGKRYAVMGGCGGIGQKICELLQEEGAIALPLSRSSTPLSLNLCSLESIQKTFQQLGPLDGLINSAGLLYRKNLNVLTDEEIKGLIETNFSGIVYACKYAQIKEEGHLIHIASSSYLKGKKGYAIYSAAKAALVNFSQGLVEERPDLHIHTVVPQRTHTQMRTLHFPKEKLEELLCPLQVAKAVISLLKQTSTGSLISVRRK